MASLFVIRGKDQGKRFDLADHPLTIGRDSSNDLKLDDTEVSRRHAQLRRLDEGYEVVDLGSSNGSFVNSNSIEQHELRSGDRIQLGRTLLIFTAGGNDDATSASDLAVDIVGGEPFDAGSRIVQSISHLDSAPTFDGGPSESPWLARARSNLQVMYGTALAVSHTLDIDQLAERILELIFEWVESDRGCIMLVDQETDELTPAVRRDRGRGGDSENIVISRTILDYVMANNEGVLTSNAREDARFDAAGSIVNLGVREAICVPMRGRYGVVGVIYIDTFTPPGNTIQGKAANRFREDHLKLMVAIGHQAALAIEDTSYYSAMVQAERLAAIGQTIAMLSHHIKNILQGIRGGSYLIEEGLKNEKPNIVAKGWGIVDKNQEKISNLVMDMLTFSKERDPIMEPADVNAVVGDVVELMVQRAKELSVELIWQPDGKMPQLQFDSDAMHRAVLNVITNAIDACEDVEHAVVTVSSHYDAPHALARIVVADNGTGIEDEDLRKIFSVFESRKGSRGTGLGLSVSQKILREHDGDIRVESELGVGSQFHMEFPAAPAEPEGGAPSESGETMAGS
ncbi:MAG: FHA domain-containing protein [Pirellulaceae bacterium]|jgi:signal transduction histidine kinase|nr:FHA domain-containing protein [Pirellulaceae bacterium]